MQVPVFEVSSRRYSGLVYLPTRLSCEGSSSGIHSMATIALHCPQVMLVNGMPPDTLSGFYFFFLLFPKEITLHRDTHIVSSELPRRAQPRASLIALLVDRQYLGFASGIGRRGQPNVPNENLPHYLFCWLAILGFEQSPHLNRRQRRLAQSVYSLAEDTLFRAESQTLSLRRAKDSYTIAVKYLLSHPALTHGRRLVACASVLFLNASLITPPLVRAS